MPNIEWELSPTEGQRRVNWGKIPLHDVRYSSATHVPISSLDEYLEEFRNGKWETVCEKPKFVGRVIRD